MDRTIAIGDIHGCFKTFAKLLLEVLHIHHTDQVYCLGDLVDRGPDSKSVIDFIVSLRKTGYSIHTLRGNHEQLMLNALDNDQSNDHWLVNGGAETLSSFGINHIAQLPESYLRFLKDTRHYIQTEECIFVHAGLNLLLDNPFADTETMLWDRKFQYDALKLGNRPIVHGHTPRRREYISGQPVAGSINIDGGCVYPVFNHLVALDVGNQQYYFQECVG